MASWPARRWALLYRGLLRIPLRWFFTVTSALVLLLAAGLAGQMAHFLIQGDLIPALATPVWDTSALLSTGSVPGIALHVLIGYEARPSGMQVLFYAGTLAAIALATIWMRRQPGRSPTSCARGDGAVSVAGPLGRRQRVIYSRYRPSFPLIKKQSEAHTP